MLLSVGLACSSQGRSVQGSAGGGGSAALLSVALLATAPVFLLLGAAKAVFSITLMAALQRCVPDHGRGRLLAL